MSNDLFDRLASGLEQRLERAEASSAARRLRYVVAAGLMSASMALTAPGHASAQTAPTDTQGVEEVSGQASAHQQADRLATETLRSLIRSAGPSGHISEFELDNHLNHLSRVHTLLGTQGHGKAQMAIVNSVLEMGEAAGGTLETILQERARDMLSGMSAEDERVNRARRNLADRTRQALSAEAEYASAVDRDAGIRGSLFQAGGQEARKRLGGSLGNVLSSAARGMAKQSNEQAREAEQRHRALQAEIDRLDREIRDLDRTNVPGRRTLEGGELSEQDRQTLESAHAEWLSGFQLVSPDSPRQP